MILTAYVIAFVLYIYIYIYYNNIKNIIQIYHILYSIQNAAITSHEHFFINEEVNVQLNIAPVKYPLHLSCRKDCNNKLY